MNKTVFRYNYWNKNDEMLRETLCTLGNAIFCTRGAAEECRKEEFHYPGTYLACAYNRAKTEVSGRIIENEDLVNWPNWLYMSFQSDSGNWLDLAVHTIEEFEQALHVNDGYLERKFVVTDNLGRTTGLISKRFVHMELTHYAGILWELTPINWSGKIHLRSGIDGSVENLGVKRYHDLCSKHLQVLDLGAVQDIIYLVAEARQSHVRMAQASCCRIFDHSGQLLDLPAKLDVLFEVIYQNFTFEVQQGKTIQVEKLVTIFSSKDAAISEPKLDALEAVQKKPRLPSLLKKQEQAWSRLWRRFDIEIGPGLARQQEILRLHIFHLLQTVSMNSIDRDVAVPARGWHGEAYRGHIFWDELFIFPLLNISLPELTRELLMYRYRRLAAAKEAAKKEGYTGAMFPWQSGSNGREESQKIHLNPLSGKWGPDHTFRQRHINSAIAYNVWQYFQATNDLEFMSFYGVRMLLEIARFWCSITKYEESKERYGIHQIVGPDEFHTAYPGSKQPGLNNNAYTNIMTSWTLRKAKQAFDLLAEDQQNELKIAMDLVDDEFETWDRISRKLYIPFHDNGIISQFEGYEELEEFDWEGYRKKYGDIHRLDRILKAEGKDPNRYKLAKQADVLMIFYLFSAEEQADIFQHLGYEFLPEQIPQNIHYYLSRTSHGSTLSAVTHAWVLARSDRQRSWELFRNALECDVNDVQGGTTREGIHLGAMAGTVDIVQRCYTGLEMRDEVLWFNPRLPDEISEIKFEAHYRGHWLKLSFTKEQFHVHFERGGSGLTRVGYCGDIRELRQGENTVFQLKPVPC